MCGNQGAELMGKYGINVPKGVAASSVDEVKKAIQDVFPNENEVIFILSHQVKNIILIKF